MIFVPFVRQQTKQIMITLTLLGDKTNMLLLKTALNALKVARARVNSTCSPKWRRRAIPMIKTMPNLLNVAYRLVQLRVPTPVCEL